MCCVHFRSELFFGFICAQGGFLSVVFPIRQIDTFALQIFVLWFLSCVQPSSVIQLPWTLSLDAKFSRSYERVHLAAWFLVCLCLVRFLLLLDLLQCLFFTPRELKVELMFFLQTTPQGLGLGLVMVFPLYLHKIHLSCYQYFEVFLMRGVE
jgi:hypothetical protein